MKFDEELASFEAQLSYFRPRKRVDLGAVLKDKDAEMGDRQFERHPFVILKHKPDINNVIMATRKSARTVRRVTLASWSRIPYESTLRAVSSKL